MLQTSGTVEALHDARHVGCRISSIGVHERAVGVEVIIGGAAYKRFFRSRHLFVAGGCLVGVVALCRGILLGVVAEVCRRAVEVVAVGLDHAAVLAAEGAAAQAVGALQGREDGLLGLQEVVVLYKHAGSGGGADAIFGHVVEEVVPDVDTHGAHTGMARVGVVEPVVVVADVVGSALALHAEHVGLASIPETVVADGNIFRVALDVARAVALGMVAAAVGTVEEVVMVNPDIAVVCVERQPVVQAAHDADVAEFHALGVAHQESEALDGRVVADALEGHVHL